MDARAAAIVWTPARAAALPIGHLMGMGPEFTAAVTAMVLVIVQLLRQELDRRKRASGDRRTRRDDVPRRVDE